MSLLGTQLLIVLIVLAVGLPLAALVLWSRVRGPRVVRGVQRAALLVTCQLVAVLLVAVALNDYGSFYSSWYDVFHGSPQGVRISASGPVSGQPGRTRADLSPASAGRITALPDPPYATRAQWPARGRLESVVIKGAASGLAEHAFVYLPPQYFQASYAHASFPGIEVLSGYPGADGYLVHGLNFPTVLQHLIAAHRAQPSVLVMLRPSVTYPRDTECTNVPAGPQAETFFASDLPAQIAHDYRVLPTGWGAIGGSTGGYCAVKFAMTHTRVFYAAVSIQGYFYALRDNTTGDLWGGSPVLRQLNDLEWRLRHLPAPPISVLLTTTLDQKSSIDGYPDTERFAALVTKPMTVRTIVRAHGGHDVATWALDVPEGLSWLSARLPAVPPTP
ncbi:MAG: alpha/beta hydrolase [Jatrophihabitantaceae bacterium]